MEKALNDENAPFASLDVEDDVMENLKDDLEIMKEKFLENYFKISVTSASSYAGIIAVSGHIDIDDEEESVDEEQTADCILETSFQGHNNITVFEDYSLFSNFGADLMKALKDVNHAFDLYCLSNKNQSTIKDFFPNFVSTLIKRQKRR